MEVLKLLVLLYGLDYSKVDPPDVYSWHRSPGYYGVGFVINNNGIDCLCFERLGGTYAVYAHSGPIVITYWRRDPPIQKPWKFKPRHVPGTLEGLPE